MGRPSAAILIPTHEHVATIDLAVASALEQSVSEIEVIVVGDGVGGELRRLVAGIARREPRVRFLDLPKGPHHGEVHRGTAIESTAAEIVCYLCDDDLLLPDHVESMRDLLGDADLAQSQNGYLDPAGSWRSYFADLASPAFRAWMLESDDNAVSLTGTAHTVSAYRRLPHGWRTTPSGIPPDKYMWMQFLAEPWVRARTATRVTALQFPSHLGREERAGTERRGELERWRARLATPAGRNRVRATIDRSLRQQAAAESIRRHELELRHAELAERLVESEERRRQAEEEAATLGGRLAEIESTRTWRLRARLRRVSILRALLARGDATRRP
jgi:Glycosyl transferase family 2